MENKYNIPFLIFVGISMLFNSNIMAKPVDTLTAKTVATHFLAGRNGTVSRSAQHANIAYVGTFHDESSRQAVPSYFIINTEEGFVILSADDRIEPILGYSTEGHFDNGDIPSNMLAFLDGYSSQIKSYLQNAPSMPNEATTKWTSLMRDDYMPDATKGAVIGPLLSTTWDQNSPYNALCPADANANQAANGHAYAGCVATAMAQLIRYWEYPEYGAGQKIYQCNNATESHGYYGDYGTLSAYFGSTHYLYNNMPNSISSSSPSNQITQIALLTYHCGVSVEMSYGPRGSGASTYAATNALAQYFKYSNNYGTLTPQYKMREFYSDDDWINMLKSELNEWRPVLYNGSGYYGGHAFICDGYDDQGYFHFNWGWSGSFNGYYILSSLNPDYFDFNDSHGAIIQVQGNTPMIKVSNGELSFLCAAGTSSEAKSMTIHGIALTNNIVVTAPSNFEISADGITYSSTLNVSNNTSEIYVRYTPTTPGMTTDHGTLTITSGSTTKNVALSGRTYVLECNAPQNVQHSSDNSGNVQLSWDAPIQDIHTYKFSIDSTSDGGIIGLGAGAHRYVLAQRACDSDLVAYHQKRITQISFYIFPDYTYYTSFIPDIDIVTNSSERKIVIYQGGSFLNNTLNEGTLIREQSINSFSYGWNTVTLDNPVTVDAHQELWYGVHFYTTSQYPIAYGSDPCIAGKGDLVKKDGSWTLLSSFDPAYGINYNIPLKITIQDSPSSITNYTIERDNSIVGTSTNTQYNDHVTSSGSYTYNVTANWGNGCSATSNDITVNVSTNCTTTYGDTSASACDSFDWYEHSGITTSGDYTHTFVGGNANGCDSTVTLHLTINQPTTGDTNAVACGSFNWYEYPDITTSGTYTHTFVGGNASGCDSTVTLHLTINHPTTGDTNAVACGSFDWYEHTGITTSGTYTHTFVGGNANGCDSTLTLHLTINHPTTGDTNAVACGSFDWYEYPGITTSGTYTHTFVGGNVNGCDSTVTLHLTINQPSTGDTNAVACGSFDWYEYLGITTSGDYTHTFVGGNANGCDSTVTLHLTINHPTSGDTNAVACGSFDWYEYKNITASTNSLTHTFINANGCDSVVTLHLTINNPVNTDTVAEAVETFVWHRAGAVDTTITTSGTYMHTHPDANGCAQTDTLHLTVHHATETQIDTSACESFVWHRPLAGDTIITSSGTYVDNLTDVHGADSVITLALTVYSAEHTDLHEYICQNELPYHYINGQIDTTFSTLNSQFSTLNFQFSTVHGCDSSVTLNITLFEVVNTDTTAEVVEAFVWHRAGAVDTTITTSGIYTYTHPDANGCAQTDTLHLTVYHATGTQIDTSACESYVWHRPLAGDTTITSSGNYVDNLTDVHGADSVITLALTVYSAEHTDLHEYICQNELPYHYINGQIDTTFSTLNSQFSTLNFQFSTVHGCDSSVTLNITLFEVVNTDTTAEVVEAFVWHRAGAVDTTITTSGIYTYTHPDANGCAQTDTLHLTVYHATGTQIDTSACESYVWHRPLAGDTTITSSGNYVDNLTDVHGADSVITLVLTINPTYYFPENVTVMEAQLPYLWHGQTFNENATAFDSLSTLAGCDSVFYLNLTVVPYNTIQENPIALCQGETQDWHGQLISEQGSYSDTVSAENTIYTVEVTVNPTYYFPENVTVMQAQLPYIWHGQTFYESATAFDSLSTLAGCDSVFYLNLTVTSFTIIQDNPITLCQGETQLWRGQQLSEQGTYNDTVLVENTIYTVVVTINPSYYIPENITVMEAQLPYIWHGQTFNESATAFDSLSTLAGCDSVFYLNLTVVPYNTIQENPIALCQGETQDWHGQLISEQGSYSDTVSAENTIYTVEVTVNPTYYFPENVTVMQAELPYQWHGQTFNESATAFDSLLTVAGCDSVFYLNLTVTTYTIIQDNPIALCQGETQLWRGHLLSEQGTYSDTVLAENTIYTVGVTVNPTYYFPENVTVMEAQLPYHWHGQTFNESATAFDSLSTVAGCDSVFYLNLTVVPYTIIQDNPIALCQGETQLWRGQLLSEQGSYSDTVTAENTIYTVEVSVNPTYYFPENVTVMQAELPYQWHGQTFNESATAFDSLLTVAGCDSVFYLNLTVTSFTIIQDNPIALCQGETQLWRGHLISEQGSYNDTVLVENTIYMVDVTVNPTYYFPENVTVMEAQLPYLWHGQTFNENATAFDSLSTVAGCDSVFYLNLTVVPYSIIQDNPIALCQGETQLWRGQLLSEQGSYSDTIAAENTIYTVAVSVNPTYYFPEDVTVSQTQLPFHWHGRTFYESATAFDSLSTLAGCDSIFYLNLTVTTFTIVQDNPIALCQGETQLWRGHLLSAQGSYSDTALAESIIYMVEVTINPTYYIPENVAVTQAQLPYQWHGQTFNESATAFDSLLTVAGCDSIFYLNLSVLPFNIIYDNPIALCQGETQLWRGHLLSEQGTYNDTALVENIIYTVEVTVNPTYVVDTAVIITTNDLPYHFVSGQIDTTFSTLTSQFSVFTFPLSTTEGCDSIVTLHITLNVGIENHTPEFIRAFPNPTTGHMTVIGSKGLTQLQLFDAYGRRVCVYPVEGTQTEIDLHGLASGVYFLKAMRHNQTAGTLKIIKNNE